MDQGCFNKFKFFGVMGKLANNKKIKEIKENKESTTLHKYIYSYFRTIKC